MVVQDLPPPGGFGSIPIARTAAKPMVRQGILLAVGCFATLYGAIYLGDFKRRHRILKIEQMEHYIATMPFLYAEQERKFLTTLWKQREEERKLMKNVPGWKIGTLYGEPVYKTVPTGQLPPISPNEFHAGRSTSEWDTKIIVPDFWI